MLPPISSERRPTERLVSGARLEEALAVTVVQKDAACGGVARALRPAGVGGQVVEWARRALYARAEEVEVVHTRVATGLYRGLR